MATAKKNTTGAAANRSNVANPGGRKMLIGGRTQTRRKKRSNPAQTAKKNPATPRRRYRRNPSENTSDLLFAVGGAVAINAFDAVVARLAPSLSGTLSVVGKVVAGWAIGNYGKKLPVVGQYSGIARKALYLAAALQAFQLWVMPQISGWLGTAQAAITGQTQVQNSATGELGMRYYLSDGNYIDVFDDQNAAYAS